MGGGGSILSMIISYKNNLALRNNRRKAFEKWKNSGKSRLQEPIHSKDISNEEWQALKKEIERKFKQHRKRVSILFLAITILVSLGLAFLVVHKIRSIENKMNEKQLESREQQKA